MPTVYDANLAALQHASPDTARFLSTLPVDSACCVSAAACGDPVLERGGRALDSRRDPRRHAERAAAVVTVPRVVVAGLGTGYLVEALRARGIDVAAVVDGAAAVKAALGARDLASWLREVPVLVCDRLGDAVDLATVRAMADHVVPHAPSVAESVELRWLVNQWASMRVARRAPRVLVGGPILGGTIEMARSVAQACEACHAETRLADFSALEPAHTAFDRMALPSAVRFGLQGELGLLLGKALAAQAVEWKADLVLALAQCPLAPPSLKLLRDRGITTAFWFVENGRVLPYWRAMAPHYDWFYAIQPGRFLEQLADAGAPRPRYLPVACDPARHVPVALSDAERKKYGSAVSFAGSPYLNRRRLFPSLADLDFRIWGDGWHDAALARLVANRGRRFGLDEMVRVFAASAINLNVHSAEHVAGLDPEPDYVNPRTFEIAACGAFQLVDRRDPLPDLFEPDEVRSFASLAELRALIAQYLADDEERAAMARRARARALGEHTYAHRVRRILRDTLAPALAAAALANRRHETLGQAVERLEAASDTLSEDEALTRAVSEIARNWSLR